MKKLIRVLDPNETMRVSLGKPKVYRLLVLLEAVNRADFKYVFAVWIGSQIREI